MLLRYSGSRGGRATADVARLRARGRALLMALLLLIVPASPRVAVSASARARVLSWVRVDPARPRAVYAGGYAGLAADPAFKGEPACGFRIGRSTDGGSTWHPQFFRDARSYSLGSSDVIRGLQKGCVSSDPLILSPDGSDLFSLGYDPYCASAYGCGPYLSHAMASGGQLADVLSSNRLESEYPTITGFSISQPNPKRAYATFFSYPSDSPYLIRSDDGGARWQFAVPVDSPLPLADGSDLQSHGLLGQVLADPTARDTVYLGLGIALPPRAVALGRSDDGGKSWRLLHLPLPVNDNVVSGDEKNAQGFQLATDPHLPGAVVLTVVNVPGVKADRRWASLDHGASWRQTACPGDLRGTCPTYTLDSVFGAGRAYGFYADGVHAFAGAGLAGPRLALSDRLPCRGVDVLDVGGGAHAGDPVYLLCQAPLAQRTRLSALLPNNSDTSRVGTLYRSSDAGASWRKLDPTAGW